MILGLDPGSRCTGYGLIKESSGQLILVDTGTIRPNCSHGLSIRLGYIFQNILDLIEQHCPIEAAVEDVFVAHNTSSALKLGQARGAALAACASQNINVYAYEPTLIKKSLVGSGRARKDQVSFMVGQLLGLKPQWSKDSSDALAVAICHLNSRRVQAWQNS